MLIQQGKFNDKCDEATALMAPDKKRTIINSIGIFLTFVNATITMPVVFLIAMLFTDSKIFEYDWLRDVCMVLLWHYKILLALGLVLFLANAIYMFMREPKGTPNLNSVMSSLFVLLIMSAGSIE